MGATLWSIVAIISVLLSLPVNHKGQAHAGSDGGHPFLAHRFHYRRSSGSGNSPYLPSTNDGEWGCDRCCDNESSCDLKVSEEERFLSLVNESFDSLSQPPTDIAGGPLLVHLGTSHGDKVRYWSGSSWEKRCVPASRYRTLKLLSHLPVRAAIVELLNRTDQEKCLLELERLRDDVGKISDLLRDKALSKDEEEILRRVNDSLSNGDILKTLSKEEFVTSLKKIGREALEDYLRSLNSTISNFSNLDISEDNPTVVVYVYGEFAYNKSFLVKYYQQLTNFKARIVLYRSFAGEGYCSSDDSCLTSNVLNSSLEFFQRTINNAFNNLNKPMGSIHNFLDSLAEEIICSSTLNFTSCPDDSSQPLPGFQTRIEKAYVVLFVFFGACSVVLGLFLSSILYEDRLMKAERKLLSADKVSKRERHLSTLSLESNEER